MDLQQTQTLYNLARSFAGESQAGNRYCLYAEKAQSEGSYALAALLREIARNEEAHAKVFLEHLTQGMPEPIDNLPFNAGYPYIFASTLENIEAAARAEQEEFTEIYLNFSAIATQEGFSSIAASFDRIAAVEHAHHDILTQAAQQMRSQTLYAGAQPSVWRCSHCGHSAVLTAAWSRCPLCGYPQGYVELHITAPTY